MEQIKIYFQSFLTISLLFSILLLCRHSHCQNFDLLNSTVVVDGKILTDPFVGGYNAPQLNAMDINLDGVNDLVVFDRVGNVPRCYIYNTSTDKYTYAAEYNQMFPTLQGWMILRDYNADGVMDIFTGPVLGAGNYISLYRGSIVDGRYTFEIGVSTGELYPEYLYYEDNFSTSEIYSSVIDKPEIIDIDFDGDLDVLTFESLGQYIDFYKNVCVERGLPLDRPVYELASKCYGGLSEEGMSAELLFSDSPDKCAEYQEINYRHSGSTITAINADGDADYDLIIGDLLGDSLVLVVNTNTVDQPWFTKAIWAYPTNTKPLHLPTFLSAYSIDVDHDGINDLIGSPNSTQNGQNADNIWLYTSKNGGYTYQQDDFLCDEMIDLGSYSSPKFVDVNADNLMDIVVGTRGKNSLTNQIDSRLVYFQNIGTSDNPAYRLADDDFADYNKYIRESADATPAFGDLDGDGDTDMVVIGTNGNTWYSENIAGVGNPLQFADTVEDFVSFLGISNAKPCIYDFNKDGLGDLLIGERYGNTNDELSGAINYIPNLGTVGNPVFNGESRDEPNVNTFGLIDTKIPGQTVAYSSPTVIEAGDSIYLASGSSAGQMFLYSIQDMTTPLTPATLISDNLGFFEEGSKTVLDLADIDEDGFYEVVIGNQRGGIAIYNTIIQTNGLITDVELIQQVNTTKVYPNPVNNQLYIDSDQPIRQVSIYSLTGELLINQVSLSANDSVDMRSIGTGIYIVKVQSVTGTIDIHRVCKH